MCFHQPAPNHGEDGRLLLLLLSALHFINLKSLFVVVVVVVAADITHLKAQASLWIAGRDSLGLWCPMKSNAKTKCHFANFRGKQVCGKKARPSVQYRISVSGHKTSRTRTLASLLNQQLAFAWLGTWLLFLHDHLGGSFLLIFSLQQSADEPLRVTLLTSISDETILPIFFLLRPKMF